MLLAGAVSALGFAPLNIWPLPFLALAVLVGYTQRTLSLRAAFIAGWCFAFGHFVVCLNWIATAFTHQDSMPAWIGWIGVVLLSAYLALFSGLAAGLAWRFSRGQRLAFVWLFAAAWMVCEWLRSGLFGGFAWNPLAVLWVPLPILAQGTKWIGTYGMSGLLVLVSGLLWLSWAQRRWGAATALVLPLVVFGTWLGHSSKAPPLPTAGLPVRIVQPNISQDEKYDPGQADANIQRYLNLSGPRPAEPRVLLWPEGATLGFLEHQPAIRAQLARLLGPRDLLLTGGASIVLTPDGDLEALHNSVFAIDSEAKVAWRYDKAHLVPFGEYLPARPFLQHLGLSRLVPAEADFSPGPGPRTFVLGDLEVGGKPVTVGVQICYEIIFAGRVIDERHRPSFLFNPSNDAWFGAWGPPQHLAQAQLRAIEEGVPVIRATPNGISALISPTGQLLATVPRHLAGTIDTHVPEALPPTLFARLGLWTSALFGLLLAAAGILASRAGSERTPTAAPLPERPSA
jgi:apolipoprotein N-acyltransferase